MRHNTDNYRQLFLDDIPLMDVRAPVEFARGAFPTSENHPLLDDRQREAVGTEYKQAGQQAAIDLGWTLATDEVRAERLAAWRGFIERHPNGYLYCFRGGLRSRTAQQLLREAGIDYPLVEGGYKAMRTFLIEELARQCARLSFVVLSGHTGSGKTELLQYAHRAVDLEGIARHRGSSFGRTSLPQPSQIDFENELGIELLKLGEGQGPVFLEDESRLIGRCALPVILRQGMHVAPRVLVDEPVEDRARRIVRDYVSTALTRFADADEGPHTALGEELRTSLARLRKRLGGLRHQQLDEQLAAANAELARSGNSDGYIPVVMSLLSEYYDRAYDHTMQKHAGTVLFRGTYAEVAEWLASRPGE
ncbi:MULTISPECIES: tRNA 2-selenouridine(34) synthase MnmH [Microbulbifer]|uniref:tRNA 2-selenouridine(34) synthase MnmH n=1 Tax=Microbulbifer TaxID=48073 RepID=UPI001E44DDD8|nr:MULTISPECIES: tRNA 2-selenouridine(34) synthase MnmH [Microbulbifer]UHQ56834.1 tRNA 2-selenouridine(34) synthase MnmH [Microbulbifer sp. YPW16]